MAKVAIDRIISEICDYTKATGSLQANYFDLIRADIDRFIATTNDLSKQMYWQGWTVFSVSALGAGLSVAGALIPKGGAALETNPRLNANAGIGDAISDLFKKMGEGDFLRTTCKTGGKFLTNGVSSAVGSWFNSETTKLEAKRELLRVAFQEGQQERSLFHQETNKAQERALAILQAKSRAQ
jgi:hypothetical protein